MQQFYEIVNEETVKTESHIRNIESQMEKMQDTHRNDIRIYLQKVATSPNPPQHVILWAQGGTGIEPLLFRAPR